MANLEQQGFRFMRREDGDFAWVRQADKKPGDFDCTAMDDSEFGAFMCIHSHTKEVDQYIDGFNEAEADVCDGMVRNDFERGSAEWFGYEFGVRLFSIAREDWEAQTAYDARWNSLPELPLA